MATTKLGNTKSASRAINYAEKRAEEKSGLNCDVDYAKSAFKQTRALYGKESGVQAHTVIQSFSPGEVTPEQCNELGLELAERIAPNHQVAVYTHTDKDHYHNHIVINSVDLETGKKYQSNKKQRELVKKENDSICHKYGLSIPEKQKESRYTQAEYEIAKDVMKGKREKLPWKEEIRTVIDNTQVTNYEQLGNELLQHGIKIDRITDKTITYKHLEEDKKVRGSKLGEKYDKGGLEYGFDGRIKRQKELEQSKPIERKQSDQRERDWEDFARTTSSIEQDRKRREQEKREREEEERRIEAENRRAREEREREEQQKRQSIKKSRGFDLEL